MKVQQLGLILLVLNHVARVSVETKTYANCTSCTRQVSVLNAGIVSAAGTSKLILAFLCELSEDSDACYNQGNDFISLVLDLATDILPDEHYPDFPWICSVRKDCDHRSQAAAEQNYFKCKTCTSVVRASLSILKGSFKKLTSSLIKNSCKEDSEICAARTERDFFSGILLDIYDGKISPKQFCTKFTTCKL